MNYWILNTLLAAAPATQSTLKLDMTGSNGQIQMNMPVQMLILLTLLSFLPAIIISLSSFTRIIIVFHFLRQALGTQEAPSNQILIGLALCLSFFIMSPTLTAIYDNAYQPWSTGQIDQDQAIERGTGPLKQFMLKSDGISDRFRLVPALPRHRYGRIVGPLIDGNDAVAAGHGIAAFQNLAFHHGRWLEPGHRLTG